MVRTNNNINNNINGILVIDKPSDFTSFDVVAKLRNILSIKKIGHGGTLDPMATGVLPVFINKATKIIEIISDQDKKYVAGFKLGIKTDTQDITGNIIDKNFSNVSEENINNILNNFVGEIEQIPPMYSAIKVNGQKLYNLARQGKEIERKSRKIKINNIKLLSFDSSTQEGMIEAWVSKGTYIRTLIYDIGEKLGVGATLLSLRRTKALGFDITQSISLDKLEEEIRLNKNNINKKIISIEEVLKDFPQIVFKNDLLKKIDFGQKIQLELPINIYHKIYDEFNNFLGIGFLSENKIFKFKSKI